MNLLIKNGRIVDPDNKIDKVLDILVSGEKISRVGKNLRANGAKIIDAKGKLVTPGLIDLHVHLREPGQEYKETIQTASRAAARGGITSIVGMPNTNPAPDNQTVIEFILSKAKKEAIVNVFPVGTMTKKLEGEELAEIWETKDTGAVAVTDDHFPVKNADLMYKTFEYCRMLNMPVISHSEDTDLAGHWAMNEGYVSTKLGLPAKPAAAEEIMIAREIILSEATGCSIHFTHINTERSALLIRDAKRHGIKVTCDTCPHYFTLTEEAVLGYNPQAKMNPPLRPKKDMEAMKKYLHNDVIDVIATDHAPHALADKYLEFEDCANGIVGLETSLPLVMTHLVHEGYLTYTQLVEKMSLNPAKILHLNKGTLSIGADADITIIDPKAEEIIDKNKFESKGRNTPFDGWKVKGIPVITIVGGKVVMRERKIIV